MTIKLKTNADVVANIAPLLGFVPTNSIVIYLLVIPIVFPLHFILICLIIFSPHFYYPHVKHVS